jgi:hypothetical protein
MPRPELLLSALLALQGVAYYGLSQRTERPPESKPLAAFATRAGEWHAVREGAVDGDDKDVLRADDYLMRDYAGSSGQRASLFIAYFRSQRAGVRDK